MIPVTRVNGTAALIGAERGLDHTCHCRQVYCEHLKGEETPPPLQVLLWG